jgi:MFS family permease
VGAIFSVAIGVLGLTAAFGGPWIAKQGPRKAMVLSAILWVSGYLVASLGVSINSLPVVFLGYGVIGGIGLGIGYVAPVATLMGWFPDKPGLATGMAIMGFGGGALVASPLANAMLDAWGDTPADAVGKVYLVLAVLNAVLMMWGAAVIRTAPDAAEVDPHGDPIVATVSSADVAPRVAVKQVRFWLLWFAFFANVTAGIGILEQASPMIQTFFSDVTPAGAAGFVGVLSLANMAGRFGWSTLSDKIGRPATFFIFAIVGTLIYATLASGVTASVAVFVALTFVMISFYGGGFSALPAYLKDLYGQKHISVILGIALTAWSAAGVIGPLVINSIVDSRAEAGITGASQYQPAMWLIAGLLALAIVANFAAAAVGRADARKADARKADAHEQEQS